MAANCLRLLLECLKQDLCEVEAPGTPRSAISAEKINTCLPSDVRYACLYWVYHFNKADIYIFDGADTHAFLIRHFLYWIEALALIGKALESLGLIKMLQARLKVRNHTNRYADFLANYNLASK